MSQREKNFLKRLHLGKQGFSTVTGFSLWDCSYCNPWVFLSSGGNPKLYVANLPRECIRHFFLKRKCFVFDQPTKDKELLANIENVPENELDPKFQEQTKNFCSYIYTQSRTKTLREGIMVTGKRESPFHILWGLTCV